MTIRCEEILTCRQATISNSNHDQELKVDAHAVSVLAEGEGLVSTFVEAADLFGPILVCQVSPRLCHSFNKFVNMVFALVQAINLAHEACARQHQQVHFWSGDVGRD